MGYRALLKKFLLHLELSEAQTGVTDLAASPVLTGREIAELKQLLAELSREGMSGRSANDVPNYNLRLRMLMVSQSLDAGLLSQICDISAQEVAWYLAHPKSQMFRALPEARYREIHQQIENWLASQ